MNADKLTTNCTLSCGCTRVLVGNHHVGEILYCRTHQRTATIVTNLPEYRAVCQWPKCRYGSRPFGQALLTAQVKASTHSVKYQHTVHIMQGDQIIETCGAHHQPPLPGLST